MDGGPSARQVGPGACDRCLARTWLLARLAGHLDVVRNRIDAVLELEARPLIHAVAGEHASQVTRELAAFNPRAARTAARERQLELICRCAERYPRGLLALDNPPCVLHVAGGLERLLGLVEQEAVAVVGARGASAYGIEVARALAGSLSAAGIAVLSGMADGIDSAAHAGALSEGGRTIAVLPCGADRAYPRAKGPLYRRILSAGALVSELPPGTEPRRWMFLARNRILAALAAMTVVVEAGQGSGALVTARIAASLGRGLGAVPGRVTTPGAAGTNALLAAGACVIRDAQDVLDELLGAGVVLAPADRRPTLTRELGAMLAAVAAGHDTPAALERAGFATADVLARLASLELAGYVRRGPGGRFVVRP